MPTIVDSIKQVLQTTTLLPYPIDRLVGRRHYRPGYLRYVISRMKPKALWVSM